MTYFPDLSPYRYSPSAAGELNVGWLDPAHAFETAPPSEALLDALWELGSRPVAASFGIHECALCPRDPPTAPREVTAVE